MQRMTYRLTWPGELGSLDAMRLVYPPSFSRLSHWGVDNENASFCSLWSGGDVCGA